MPMDSWVSYELSCKTLTYIECFSFNRDSYTKFSTDPFSSLPESEYLSYSIETIELLHKT